MAVHLTLRFLRVAFFVDMVRPEMINSRVSARARSPITGTSKEMHAASFAWIKDQLDEWGMPTEG